MARLAKTLQANYGQDVAHPRQLAEAEARRKATLKERYGAENVFSRESSLYTKVREAGDANRKPLYGEANPFSWPEVQEKIRQTNLDKFGVENPQQSPEVRSKTQATNLERYGVEEILAAPAIRRRIEATNEALYGGPTPSCSPGVVERARQTNLERWGVEWTAQHPEIRRQQLETMIENYGSHFFASEVGRTVIRERLVEKYGVDHSAKIDGFWDRLVATFVRKYGVTHPLLLAEFLEARRETCQERYGVDNPLQSPEVYARLIETVRVRYGVDCVFQAEFVKEASRQTNTDRYGRPYFLSSDTHKQDNIAKYGVPHPMMNREYALAHLEKMSRPGPNLLERRFASAHPTLMYVGNGAYWRWLPKLGHHKNPDFILPGPDSEHPKKGVTKIVELFGDYWHSKIFTGKADFDHEQELVAAYAESGYRCLIVWESEFKQNPQEVNERVHTFLSV